MKNLTIKAIMILMITMLSFGAFSQTDVDPQNSNYSLAKGSTVKYVVTNNGVGYTYVWTIKKGAGYASDAVLGTDYTIKSGALNTNAVEITWLTSTDYKMILTETYSGSCAGGVNEMLVKVIDNSEKDKYGIALSNLDFCASDLATQTLSVNIAAVAAQIIAYPITVKYTIDGKIGEQTGTIASPSVTLDLNLDLRTRTITPGIGDVTVNFAVTSIVDKYGAAVANTGGTSKAITIHRNPDTNPILHD